MAFCVYEKTRTGFDNGIVYAHVNGECAVCNAQGVEVLALGVTADDYLERKICKPCIAKAFSEPQTTSAPAEGWADWALINSERNVWLHEEAIPLGLRVHDES